MQSASYGELFPNVYVGTIRLDESASLQEAKQLAASINQRHPDYAALPGYEKHQALVRLAMPAAEHSTTARESLQSLVTELTATKASGASEPGMQPPVTREKHVLAAESPLGQLRQNAGQWANYSFIGGNLVWLYSAFHQKDGNTNWVDATLASAFAVSNALVSANASRQPRTAHDIIHDLDHFLKETEQPPLTVEEARQCENVFHRLEEYYRRYPWEMAAVLNTITLAYGTVANTAKALKTPLNADGTPLDGQDTQKESAARTIQAIGSFGGFLGGLSQLLIPQKNGDRFIDPNSLLQEHPDHPAVKPILEAQEHFPPLRRIGRMTESLLQRASQHRMPINATLSALDNIGVAVSGLLSPQSNPLKSYSQLFAAGGYSLQGISEGLKRLEPNEAMFAAAVYMDELLRGKQGIALEKEAATLSRHISTWLQMQTDITTAWPEKPAEQLHAIWQSLHEQRKAEGITTASTAS